MWKLTVSLVCTVIAVLTVVVGVQHIHAQGGSIVPSSPFTASISEAKYRYPSGVYAMTLQQTLYVRSDGSNSIETLENTQPVNRLTWDIPNQKRIALDYKTKSVSTTFQPSPPAWSVCSDIPADAPTNTLLGYQVRLIKEAMGPPKLNMREEKWIAPALNCLSLKTTVYRTPPNAAEILLDESTVTQVTPGAPPASAFAGHRIMSNGPLRRCMRSRSGSILHPR
jgi:hypothetical protein